MKKKILALLLALAMVFAFAACGSDNGDSANGGTPEAGGSATPDNGGETATGGKGVLRVGVKNAVVGFGYQDPLTNEYEGMEIDLAHMIADALGYDSVEFTTVTAATRTELLDSGDIDCVLATFTITEERKQSWDFSTPYYSDPITVLVEES